MTLLKVGMDPADKGKRSGRWLAIWKTPQGNFIHQKLPISDQDPKAEAEAYALANVPVWDA